MKNTDLVQLLRELADYLTVPGIERGTIPARSSCLATRALQAADGIEGRRDHDFSVGDLIDQEWDRQRCFTTDDGDRMFSQDDFECAIRRVLARYGGRGET